MKPHSKKEVLNQLTEYVKNIPDDTKWREYMSEEHARKYTNNWDIQFNEEKQPSPKAWIYAVIDKFKLLK